MTKKRKLTKRRLDALIKRAMKSGNYITKFTWDKKDGVKGGGSHGE